MAKKRGPKTMWEPPAEKAIQFKVTLRYIKPPIWRRVVLPDNFMLADLHAVIQVAMGWENCHMHAFRIAGSEYTSAAACDMGEMDELEMENLLAVSASQRRSSRFSHLWFGLECAPLSNVPTIPRRIPPAHRNDSPARSIPRRTLRILGQVLRIDIPSLSRREGSASRI